MGLRITRHGLAAAGIAALLLTAAAGCGPEADDGYAGAGYIDSEGYASRRVCPSGSTVLGVDVSKWQGTINWPSVKAAGKVFAIARISDGIYYKDAYFARNWSEMKRVGLIRGAYQFFRPNQSATTQANMVVAAVGRLGAGDLPVTIDVEVTGSQSAATIVSKIRTWVNIVKAGTGKTPMVYVGAYFWERYVKTSEFRNLPLWVAHWTTACPYTPNVWAKWTFWQYSSKGRVSGISGNVDLNRFNGSLSQLRAFAGGGGTGSKRDVAVKSFTVRQSGNLVTICATWCNYGTSAQTFHGHVWYQRSSAPSCSSTGETLKGDFWLPAGACDSGCVEEDATGAPRGTYKMWFLVDANCRIAETNEGNNLKGATLYLR